VELMNRVKATFYAVIAAFISSLAVVVAQIGPPGGGGGGTPGGSNTQIQYNNSSAFGADSGFTYGGTGQVTITPNANQVPLTSGGYSLTGSNALSLLNLSGTLNTTGSPDVVKLAITDTARGASTTLFNLYGGASGTTSEFKVSNIGIVTAANNFVTGNQTMLATGLTNTGNFTIASSGGDILFQSNSNKNAWGFRSGTLNMQGSSDALFGFTNTAASAGPGGVDGTFDTAVARNAAGVTEINNGTAGTYREAKLRSLVIGGAVPGISGCTAGTQTGGATAGTYTSGTTGTCTVTLTFAFTAPTGWACATNDLTTPADAQKQSASTTTTAAITGTTVSGDVINFLCMAY
jgi:hypothetical protein